MDAVAPVVTPVVESIIKVIKRHVGYVVSSTNNVNDMRTNMEELNAMARDMKMKKETNVVNNLMVPHYVPTWLTDVEKIYEKVGNVPTGGTGCFNIKARYRAGKRSFDILKDIDRLKKQRSEIKWSDEQRPLGKVRSTIPYTSDDPVANDIDNQNVIKSSRDLIFDKALKSLEPNNNCQMMALCGMGGIGKTTMMEQLKKVAVDRKMFDWVVKVVIGENKNQIGIQDAIADYIGQPLTEKDKYTRAERLRKKFEGILEDGSKKILVILDDLWEEMDVKDIGLTTPLPKGFKLLLTSRKEKVCTTMGVETDSIFKIARLDEREAKNMFWQIARINPDCDRDLLRIGEDILKKCGGLPMAIKTIASTLKDDEDKETWENALDRIRDESSHYLKDIFVISYNNLKDDHEKAIFLLSGLFPDDHNILIEDLMRYGWGLKLFNNLNSISKARRRVKACVGNLISSNLLIESDTRGCVKIHDLVRDFVLSNFSNVKQASLVNNDNISDQLEKDSYERILLKCEGMVEFPTDFNHPNLALLNLMDGKELTKFPEDFYARMLKLQVVAYAGIDKPLLPRHLTSLRTLCLDSCKSLGDISFIGDLINLEVLSLAFCGILNLPSAIGNLKNLKLLDLTNCVYHCIDDGIFQSLDKLEELYMRIQGWKTVRFTEDSCEGLKMVSQKLIALEFEFFNNIFQLKDVSFKKLERFRISMGAKLGDFTSENALKLVVSCEEILECKIDELFEKTEELELSVNGMICLEDILKHPCQYYFCNLKVLEVYKCADLTSIFTVNVVSNLMKLESLTVSECPLLESLVNGENNSGTNKVIKFHKLKLLKLGQLPRLLSLCGGYQVIDLPKLMELNVTGLPIVTSIFSENTEISSTMQLLFKTEVLIPKLERLIIDRMMNLKEIWCDITTGCLEEVWNISMLREIKVSYCHNMVNLFPKNPMRLLTHLETVEVRYCDSIQVLFNIDLQQGCVGNVSVSSSLRTINVFNLRSLREVWRIKGDGSNSSGIIIRDFQAVESLRILDCLNFRSILTPTAIYFDMGALKTIGISNHHFIDTNRQQTFPEFAIPSSLLHTSHQLSGIRFYNYDVKAVFDMESSQSIRDLVTAYNPNQQLPCELKLFGMRQMTHVWKCNWNEYFMCQNQHPQSLFHNITTIDLQACYGVDYLFPPIMATLLSNLQKLTIRDCLYMKQVVSDRHDKDEKGKMTPSTTYNNTQLTPTTLFPHLDSLTLCNLPILKHVGGGVVQGTSNFIHDHLKVPQAGFIYWSLCLYSREIHIEGCRALSCVIPAYTRGQRIKVEVMMIQDCKLMKEVFATTVDNDNGIHSSSISDETDTSVSIPRHGNITAAHKLSNLKTMHINKCESLEYIFTFSTLESLKNLKEIRITECKAMKVIVREEEEEERDQSASRDRVKVVVFPRVEVIELISLSNLEGFFSGIIKEFHWPQLNDFYIEECPKISAFTRTKSIAPRLKYVKHPIFGKLTPQHYNFYMTAAALPRITSPNLESTNSGPTISNDDEKPRSLQDIKELNVENAQGREIIASNELLHLQNLEKIHAKRCKWAEKIFEVELEVTDSEFNSESQLTTSVVKLPKLREVVLEELRWLEYLWKSNQWRQLELPNLTRLSIHNCRNLRYVITISMVGSLVHLQELHVTHCDRMREIVKVDDDDDSERKVSLPCLKFLKLEHLENLLGFCLWDKEFLLPSLSSLVIKQCPYLSVFTNGFVAAPKLRWLEYLWKSNQWRQLELPNNLTRLSIHNCEWLKHVFTTSMVGSLMQLQELHVTGCRCMFQIVIEDDDCERKVLPCLKSLKLEHLPSLIGFCLWEKELLLPSLSSLVIKQCPDLSVFTNGFVAAPELKQIEINGGLIDIGEQDINSFIITNKQKKEFD